MEPHEGTQQRGAAFSMAHGRPRKLSISRTALSDRKAEARDGLPRELDGSLTRDFDDWQ
jgi:hypothetical protein